MCLHIHVLNCVTLVRVPHVQRWRRLKPVIAVNDGCNVPVKPFLQLLLQLQTLLQVVVTLKAAVLVVENLLHVHKLVIHAR